ncbi:MAG: hypothetical protein ACI9VR_001576 [Cognaticolwellia sp.]|jgi:hypothetical protein
MTSLPLLLLLASEPVSQVLTDGRVQVRIHVNLPPEAVRAEMDSPGKIAMLTQAAGIESEHKDGPCWLVHRKRDLLVYSIDWHTRACPTDNGLTETMLRGEGIESYRTDWQVLPDGEGSVVQLQVTSITGLPVPLSLVQSTSIKESEESLVNLKAALEAK